MLNSEALRRGNHGKWKIFTLSYCCYSVLYISRKAFSIVKSDVQSDLGLSAYGLSVIDSSFLVTYATFQLFLPSLSEVYGARKLLFVCYSSAAAFALLFAMGSELPWLSITWFAEGIAHSAVFAVLVNIVSDWFPIEERTAVLGVWTTSQQVGAVAGTALATYLNEQLGWRATFIVSGIVTGAMALVIGLWLPDRPPILPTLISKSPTTELVNPESWKTADRTQNSIPCGAATLGSGEEETHSIPKDPSNISVNYSLEGPAEIEIAEVADSLPSGWTLISEPADVPLGFYKVLRLQGIALCSSAYFCVKLIRYSLLFWLPFYLSTQLGLSKAAAGYTSAIFDIGGIFGAIGTGILLHKTGKSKFAVAAAMIFAGSIGLMLFPTNVQNSNITTHNTPIAAMNVAHSPGGTPTDIILNNKNIEDGFRSLDLGQPTNISHSRFLEGKANEQNTTTTKPLSADDGFSGILSRLEKTGRGANSNVLNITIWLAVLGLLLAGPDSILGASGAVELCRSSTVTGAEHSSNTATGIVNGIGAFGGVVQGQITAAVAEEYGWPSLFVVLGTAGIFGAVLLVPILMHEHRNRLDETKHFL